MVKGLFALLVTAEAGTLAVTWEDCGAKHTTISAVEPSQITTGGVTTVTGTGVVDEDVTAAKFTATVKALGVKVASCDGDGTTDITCNLPLGAGKIVVKAVSYPLAAGSIDIPVDVTTKSVIPASLEKVDVHIAATEQNGEDVICLDVHTKKQESFEDPTQPHLAQAWTAQSTGDGLPGAVGDEAYFFTDTESHHLWDYGAQGSKLWSCKGAYNCIEYYLKLNAVDCCKCEDVNEPKMWDIPKSGLFTKVNFNGYEDTTELNDNPVQGAEHWFTSSALPKVLTVTYDYFLHREDSGDVVTHRINFNTSVGQAGEILYGGFQAAHDLDAHRQKFAVPQQCTGNILTCCDAREEIMAKWFKHDHAVEQTMKAEVAV